MNSLEFINKEIENLKSLLELDDVLCELSDNDYKFCNDRLQTLEQIKSELEAWEVAKNKLEYFEGDSSVGIEEGVYQTSKYTPKEIKILKEYCR